MTKIKSVAAYPLSVPRPQPVWTAHERSTAWNAILVQLRTDDGLAGHGIVHAGPAPRVCEYVAKFGEFVAGMDALATTAVWEKLFALTSPRPGAIGGGATVPAPVARGDRTVAMAAIAGIDIALWDLKGRAANMPVYRLLGGENRPLHTYATGGYYRGVADKEYGAELARFLELGYRAVKLKCGAGSVEAEVKRVAAVRRAIGDSPDLMLDMNAPYDLPDCIDFAHRVEASNIFWLEEPLHWYLQPGRRSPWRMASAN
jgi:L-alanine-DL-glutamate epimerase-like enolase superfamily enzyme